MCKIPPAFLKTQALALNLLGQFLYATNSFPSSTACSESQQVRMQWHVPGLQEVLTWLHSSRFSEYTAICRLGCRSSDGSLAKRMRTSKPNLSVNALKSLVMLLWNIQFWNNSRQFGINVKLLSFRELCHKFV